jgi:hypothetical protein
LRFLGQLKHGIRDDDCEGIHPDTINQYYGVNNTKSQTAGHSSEETDSDLDTDADSDSNLASGVDAQEELVRGISHDQQRHIRHKGVKVPRHCNPFTDGEEEGQFFQVLAEVIGLEIEPKGYGLHPEEWEGANYPIWEFIKVGKQRKEMKLSLEDPLWRCRAILWVQGLNVLAHFGK